MILKERKIMDISFNPKYNIGDKLTRKAFQEDECGILKYYCELELIVTNIILEYNHKENRMSYHYELTEPKSGWIYERITL
jgi:hypothetical protein